METYASGVQRTDAANNVRLDLICPVALLRLAAIYKEGSLKYGDVNWCGGMPISETLNHAERHLQLYKAGDQSEDNLAKVLWNIMAIMHFESKCQHHKVNEQQKTQDQEYIRVNTASTNQDAHG